MAQRREQLSQIQQIRVGNGGEVWFLGFLGVSGPRKSGNDKDRERGLITGPEVGQLEISIASLAVT